MRVARNPTLNADVGEGMAHDEELIALLDEANIACGGHAGDEQSMKRCAAACARHGVVVGAHPSYPDRAGFGRQPMKIAADALYASLVEQMSALQAIAPVRFVKPHGALYHAAGADEAALDVVVRAVRAAIGEVPLVLMWNARLLRPGMRREGFADRGTDLDGNLLPRGQPGALLAVEEVPVALQKVLPLVDTVCVHGDGPHALDVARAVRRVLDSAA